MDGDIAIDTETMGLNLDRDRLCLLQLSFGDGNAYLVKFKNDYSAPNLKKLISDESRQKIFHYGRFDIAIIQKHFDIKFQNIFCTKIASKLVRTYTEYHGLKDLCRELLGVQISKQQQSSYWGQDELTKEQMDYAAADVLYLHRLREALTNMLNKEGRYQLALDLIKCLPARVEADLAGWNDIDLFAH